MPNHFDFDDPAVVAALPIRTHPYWNVSQYCRQVGVGRRADKPSVWMARVRLKSGTYKHKTLGICREVEGQGISHQEAQQLANRWFAQPEISSCAAAALPLGPTRELKYTKTVAAFTIGDALHDFIEWKRVAAAPLYFDSTLSLTNHHLIPRLGNQILEDFTARDFTDFCVDVLQSPPKYGRQRLGASVSLDQLPHERLRKRKKTLNALIGILKSAFQMAWENQEISSDRPWRLLKRVPHADVPRHIFLTRSQAKRLVAASPDNLSKLIRGALYTGCRVSELAQLKVRDVGGHFFGIYVAPLKSIRGRYVNLPDEGMSFFLDQCDGKQEEDLVFTTDKGRAWKGNHKHLFKAAVRRAGLPDQFVFHGLRHTYASQLVQAGMPLAIVARQLGHANTDTVSRTYGHLSCQTIEQELALRFAPLEGPREDARLSDIRRGLSDVWANRGSWPEKNFSTARGDLLNAIGFPEPAQK